jgi:hypothetical protein
LNGLIFLRGESLRGLLLHEINVNAFALPNRHGWQRDLENVSIRRAGGITERLDA